MKFPKINGVILGLLILVIEFLYFYFFKQGEWFNGVTWVLILMYETPITYIAIALIVFSHYFQRR